MVVVVVSVSDGIVCCESPTELTFWFPSHSSTLLTPPDAAKSTTAILLSLAFNALLFEIVVILIVDEDVTLALSFGSLSESVGKDFKMVIYMVNI